MLENMDVHKSDGRTVQELERYFELLPEAGFCLDVAHAWSLDPTMGLAYDRDARLFMPVLEHCRDLPWIFEAPVPWLLGAANDGVGEQEQALLLSKEAGVEFPRFPTY